MTSEDKLKPLFTVVIDVYWGIEFFKKAISSAEMLLIPKEITLTFL